MSEFPQRPAIGDKAFSLSDILKHQPVRYEVEHKPQAVREFRNRFAAVMDSKLDAATDKAVSMYFRYNFHTHLTERAPLSGAEAPVAEILLARGRINGEILPSLVITYNENYPRDNERLGVLVQQVQVDGRDKVEGTCTTWSADACNAPVSVEDHFVPLEKDQSKLMQLEVDGSPIIIIDNNGITVGRQDASYVFDVAEGSVDPEFLAIWAHAEAYPTKELDLLMSGLALLDEVADVEPFITSIEP